MFSTLHPLSTFLLWTNLEGIKPCPNMFPVVTF
jgi:hypothetical protein